MFIKKEKLKEVIKEIIDEHGFIKDINDNDGNNIGFFIRREVANYPSYSVIKVLLAFNNTYDKTDKYFFKSDYKYFAISHILKNSELLPENGFSLGDEDETVSEMMLSKLKNKIKEIVYSSINNDININKDKLINFIYKLILNVENYYKNKKIYVYF